MWPFGCKECIKFNNAANSLSKIVMQQHALLNIKWLPLTNLPPLHTNLLVANKDFTFFGFLNLEEGWDYSRKINMWGKDGIIWATYTNPDSIAWWLNLDLIKKDINER